MKGISTVHVKMFDVIVRELKEVRYVLQLKKNLICWCFKNVGSCGIHTRWCSQDGQKLNGALKGVRQNNLYYLNGSTITGQVETSISLDDVCAQVWQMRVGHGGEKSLQALAKKGSLEGASTCNMELCGHGVMARK